MATHKFLRDDGWFQFLGVGDITTTGTATTTGFLNYLTNSTTQDLSIANGSFTTGPSVAQGSSGIWFATGYVTIKSTVGNVNFTTLLSDGTNTYASAQCATVNNASKTTVALSAVAASPAGNLRLASAGAGSSGTMVFNDSAASKDCTITVIRIG